MSDIMERFPYPEDQGRTHWEGCWRDRGHHNCAVAEIERLRAALGEIAQLTPTPSEHEWRDCWGDPADYLTWTGTGTERVPIETGVDISNSGDTEDYGYEMGLWHAANIARRALGELVDE